MLQGGKRLLIEMNSPHRLSVFVQNRSIANKVLYHVSGRNGLGKHCAVLKRPEIIFNNSKINQMHLAPCLSAGWFVSCGTFVGD